MALGRTIQELVSTITEDELLAWKEYYRLWPFDDYTRFHRPAALIASAFGGGGDEGLETRLNWLDGNRKRPGGGSTVDRSVISALGG